MGFDPEKHEWRYNRSTRRMAAEFVATKLGMTKTEADLTVLTLAPPPEGSATCLTAMGLTSGERDRLRAALGILNAKGA